MNHMHMFFVQGFLDGPLLQERAGVLRYDAEVFPGTSSRGTDHSTIQVPKTKALSGLENVVYPEGYDG